jgi:DNA primase
VKVMTGAHAQTEGDLHELRLELRDLLNRMLDRRHQRRAKSALILRTRRTDPTALERYRALEQKRNALLPSRASRPEKA